MTKSNLQHVVNAGFDLDQIKRFANEILGTGLQRAQLVTRLGSQHNDR